MIASKCRLCNSKKLYEFLDLGYHPPSDQFVRFENLNSKVISYPLKVLSCVNCGFKQLNYIVDPKILYQKDYPYESSLTKVGQKHFQEFADSVTDNFKLKTKDLVIDIGSNVGVLLSAFKSNGLRVLGVDPAQNICKIARKNGFETICSFYNKKTVKKIIKKYGHAKVVTGTNVFAHIDNLRELIKNVFLVLDKKKGIAIFEMPHFLNLIKKIEYDTIYHEHLSYITILPLIKFLKNFNIEIIKVEKKDIHGGSVRIFLSKKNNYKIDKSVKEICNSERKAKLNDKKTLHNFSEKVKKNRIDLVRFLNKCKLKNKKVIAISAPAKGMTLLNYCKLDNNYLEYVTEKSKLKQGKFTPGCLLPVYSDSFIAKTKPDYALILAWNFADEIIKNNKKHMKKNSKFIIPIPRLKIINK